MHIYKFIYNYTYNYIYIIIVNEEYGYNKINKEN